MSSIPSPPSLGFSFTSFSASNPTAQQPGASIDAEFNRTNNALAQLIDAILVSFNSDGTLKSSAVEDAYNVISGGGGGGEINVWDIPSAHSAILAQYWAEYMAGPVPTAILAYGGVDGTHWSAAWYADQAAQYNSATITQVNNTLTDFVNNFPIATPTKVGGVKPIWGGGLVIGIDGSLSVIFGGAAGTVAQGNDARIVGAEQRVNKGARNGYAPLDAEGMLPRAIIPDVFILPQILDGMVYANISGSTESPVGVELSFAIDEILGSTRGGLLCRGPFGWAPLAPGLPGTVLESEGYGSSPVWVDPGTLAVGLTPSGTVAENHFAIWGPEGTTLLDGGTILTQLDSIGHAQGNILYRSGTAWSVLAPGTAGQALTSGGAAANPRWADPGDASLDAISSTRGDILFRGATAWSGLAAGTAGQLLSTGGTGADPSWVNADATILDTIDLGGPPVQHGDIIYRGAAEWLRLPVGTSGQLLQTNGAAADPSWVNAPPGTGSGTVLGPSTSVANHLVLWDSTNGTLVKDSTLTSFLDTALGSTRGTIIYRGASNWATLSPGGSGQVLTTGGPSSDPAWATPSGGGGGGGVSGPVSSTVGHLAIWNNTSGGILDDATVTSVLDAALGSTQGDVLYRGSSSWAVLAPGTSGDVLTTGGAGANPSWVTPSGGGGGSPSASLAFPFVAGKYYWPYFGSPVGVAPGTGYIAFYPFIVAETCTLMTLSIPTWGSNSGTAHIRCAIYSDNHGVPDGASILLGSDTGDVTTTSTVTTITSGTLNSGSGVVLAPGRYWAASQNNGLGGMNTYGPQATGTPTMMSFLQQGSANPSSIVAQGSWLMYAQAYGAFPSTCPTTGYQTYNSIPPPILGF